MGRSTRVVVSVCLLAILLAVFEPRPAGADPFGTGTTNTGFLADNHDHDWCWSTNWPSSWTTDATNRHINLENQTLFSGGSNESCGSGTHVYWKASATSLGTNWGSAHCDDVRSGNVCDNASITINSASGVIPSAAVRKKVMCHELGHTTGGTHYSGTALDCMVGGNSILISYRSHLVNHMNSLTRASS